MKFLMDDGRRNNGFIIKLINVMLGTLESFGFGEIGLFFAIEIQR